MSTVPKIPQMPTATDGTDVQGVLRRHYAVALKRFAKFAVVLLPLFLSAIVTKIDYLLPLSIAGFIGLLSVAFLLYGRISSARRCARVFRTYPLEFRAPVGKVHEQRPLTLYLRLGGEGGGARIMRAKRLSDGSGWPEGIENGIWFAGDELFGGAAVVPGSEVLLFMQPSEWKETDAERRNAGEERAGKAGRAGLKQYVVPRL
ncbi:hypothetical protein ACFW9F_12470 [Streptomyces sp. NPDC059506]|uniref:hypothetical protein n=1 Tax=unclassified Streptomyces TaxID=2593676 RepID=UPI0022AA2C66|nr:hypothetical protein [Streptomyces sp. HB2AG]MCZ2527507.1 hypothetical protein [Streptomyces sp. HB2AG]